MNGHHVRRWKGCTKVMIVAHVQMMINKLTLEIVRMKHVNEYVTRKKYYDLVLARFAQKEFSESRLTDDTKNKLLQKRNKCVQSHCMVYGCTTLARS